MSVVTVDEVLERRRVVEDRIRAAGGSTDDIDILAVTKTFPAEVARVSVAAGLSDLGENYAQEIAEKGPLVEGARWHFIGGLQRNKVRKIAAWVSLWQTVDRLDLATEIAKRSPGARILVQVNTTGEPQKSGCEPIDVDQLVDDSRALGLDVAGLMTVGPTAATDPRPAFALLRAKLDQLGLSVCSMGMSGDLEAAVAEGTTMVRVGSALFGPRSAAR